MSDHAKDNPPTTPPDTPSGSWEDAPAFREIFLVHFPPEAAESFRQAGRHLYDSQLEGGGPRTHYAWVESQVRALAADLRFTARVLKSLSQATEQSALEEEEHQLASRCEVWAGEVLAIVLGIEGALDSEAGS